MNPLGAQTLVIGTATAKPRSMNGVTKASAPSMVSDRDGAPGLSMPIVPCPMATTGQPPGGGVALG